MLINNRPVKKIFFSRSVSAYGNDDFFSKFEPNLLAYGLSSEEIADFQQQRRSKSLNALTPEERYFVLVETNPRLAQAVNYTAMLGFSNYELPALKEFRETGNFDIDDEEAEALLRWAVAAGSRTTFRDLRKNCNCFKNVENLNKVLTNKYHRLLYVASVNGHAEIVSELLKIPFYQDQRNLQQDPPYEDALKTACEQGYVEVVEVLLDTPLFREQENLARELQQGNHHILETACREGHPKVVWALLQTNFYRDQKNLHAALSTRGLLASACIGGHKKVVAILLETSFYRDQKNLDAALALNNHSLLKIACRSGHIAVVTRLLQTPYYRDSETLRAALEADEHAILRDTLADRKIKKIIPNNQNAVAELLLGTAFYQDRENLEAALLIRRPESQRESYEHKHQALLSACKNAEPRMVKQLLQTSLYQEIDNLNEAMAEDGHFALVTAYSCGDLETSRLLQNTPFYQNPVNLNGALFRSGKHDALISACRHGHVNSYKALLAMPFYQRVERVDEALMVNSHWALRGACEWGHIKIVDLLLVRSFYQEPENLKEALEFSDHATLRGACKDGHFEVAGKLLSTPFYQEPKNLKEALQFENHATLRGACENGHYKIVQLLLNTPFYQEPGNLKLVFEGHILLKEACKNDHHKLIAPLLQTSFYQDSKNIDAMFEASNDDEHVRANILRGFYQLNDLKRVVKILLNTVSEDGVDFSEFLPKDKFMALSETAGFTVFQILQILKSKDGINKLNAILKFMAKFPDHVLDINMTLSQCEQQDNSLNFRVVCCNNLSSRAPVAVLPTGLLSSPLTSFGGNKPHGATRKQVVGPKDISYNYERKSY